MWWLLLVATASSSFVISRRSVSSGAVISTNLVDSLKDCTNLCSKNTNCSGINFLIDAASRAHCLLVDGSQQARESEKLLADAVLYSGKQFDLNDECLGKSFSFERWPNRVLKNNASVLADLRGVTLQHCLKQCQEKGDCLSAIFLQPDHCLLSSISPNTVYNTRNHYDFDEEADLYENNCRGNDISRFDSQCSWMRVKASGLPQQWDSREKVENVEECERLCLVRDRVGDPCRSYTFDSTTRNCFLSQVSARLSGKSPLEHHESRYSHGDLDDCIDFSLHCQEEGFELRGQSIRQFSGYVRTKEGKQMICNKPILPAFEYSIKMGFEECGLKKSGEFIPLYRGVVHVKEGSTPLITIRDKVLQVECRLHSQMPMAEQTLAVEMKVDPGNRTDKILSNKVLMVPTKAPPTPKYSLRVLDFNGSPSDTVHFGDHGWVQIKLNHREVAASFSISKLEARDTKNSIRVALLDDEGSVSVDVHQPANCSRDEHLDDLCIQVPLGRCILNGSIVERVTRPSPEEIKFLINYEFFEQGAEIVFYAYAEPCGGNCDPKCNEEYFEEKKTAISSSIISTRSRRSITAMQIELTQDLYPLHGSKVILLGSSTSNVPALQSGEVYQEKVEPTSLNDSLLHCLLQDSSCFFSFALASIQFCLVILCIIVMFCYVRQYRIYRASLPPGREAIEETKY